VRRRRRDGSLDTIEETHLSYLDTRLKRLSPFFIPKLIGNLAPAHISMRFGARGINYAPSSACASGAHGVGESFRLIRDGYLDAAICGGSEAAVTPLGIGGFAVMRALSTRNDEPERASRPFDKKRDGFVMGEGAGDPGAGGVEAACARGARIYAESSATARPQTPSTSPSPLPRAKGPPSAWPRRSPTPACSPSRSAI
jgi:3-oxoacyl-[acyl-carrier-protein] synthase II